MLPQILLLNSRHTKSFKIDDEWWGKSQCLKIEFTSRDSAFGTIKCLLLVSHILFIPLLVDTMPDSTLKILNISEVSQLVMM